jgi:hypothetical protein
MIFIEALRLAVYGSPSSGIAHEITLAASGRSWRRFQALPYP